ncbi:MAG: aconitate hydratase, partial [Candidatus Marinimicrobia bacterium]|nr:aconitate hydratase [Candidatus Neomarinimicrobiota bacterium]
MSLYKEYIKQIDDRKKLGLSPKPIDDGLLLEEIISQIKDIKHEARKASIDFFIYNVIPGTTTAAYVKANFLKDIIDETYYLEEISPDFAFELLSHMKGGPSIETLIDFALSTNPLNSKKAADILKTQVYLYEADMDKLEIAYNQGNKVAEDILISYSNAEFFTQLPELDEEIKVVTYVAGIGDISTDFLSPGGDAHSRSDRELHGQSMFEHNTNLQNELLALKEQHPDKIVMLIADKGTMGVGSSRMSG